MGAATNILESEKSAAANSYGRDENGYPGMSGSFLGVLIDTWQGMITDKAPPFSLLSGFSQQLDIYRGYQDEFGLSASGPDVEQVWDTLALIATYLDPLYERGIADKAGDALTTVKQALSNVGDGLKTFATLAVVGLGLYLYLRVEGK